MKRSLVFLVFLVSMKAISQPIANNGADDPVDFVNVLMGTDSKPSLSNGNVYPAIAMPWGMNFWTPQTGEMGNGWVYEYDADKIRGFKQTHQPSPWMNDYGQFVIMPITGKIKFDEDERASWFSHKSEIAKPFYYSVYLADHDLTTEITPTERAAFFRITYPESDSAFVVIDALDKGSYIKVVPEENKIIGYTTKNSGGVPDNFKNYFVIEFNKPFTSINTFSGAELLENQLEVQDNHVGAVIGFRTKKGEQVLAKVASSFISPAQAMRNLNEIGNDDFETVQQKGKDSWNKELQRIVVEGGSIDQKRTFYSCLYRLYCSRENFMKLMKTAMWFIIVLSMEKYCLGICLQILVFGIHSERFFLF